MRPTYLILLLVFAFSLCLSNCRPPAKVEPAEEVTPIDSIATYELDKIKIYLENSKSMGGYFKGSTKFTDQIDSYIVGLEKGTNYKGKVSAYTISEKIRSYDDINTFREDFNPRNGNMIATATSSPLDDILSRVYQDTEENEVSIVLTDGIPSGSNEDVRRIPDFNVQNKVKLKNDISISLDGIKEKGYSVLIKQGVSDFLAQRSQNNKQKKDHPYYFLDNSTFPKTFGIEEVMPNRPYYLIYIGKKELIQTLEKKIAFEAVNSVCLNCVEEITIEYCRTYSKLNNITYRGNKLNIRGRLGRGKNNANRFAYLINKNSFYDRFPSSNLATEIENNTFILIDGGIDTLPVQQCLTISQAKNLGLCGATQKNIKQYSHLITFEDTDKMEKGQTYTLIIQKSMPKWISDYHTDDDRETMPGVSYVDSDKTFGLKFLIEGINKAFSIEKNETIFTTTLN